MTSVNEKFKQEIDGLKASAEDSGSAGVLSAAKQSEIRGKVMSAIALPAPATAKYFWTHARITWVRSVVAVLLGLSLVGGTSFASDSALPGDPLYNVKLAKEKVELGLAVSENSKVQLEAEFAQTRIDELNALSIKYSAQPAGPPPMPTVTPVPTMSPTPTPHFFVPPGFMPSPTPTAFSSVTPTPTASPTPTPGNNGKTLEAMAKDAAQVEVSTALKDLKKFHDQLQAGGQSQAAAAAALEARIQTLQTQAQGLNLNLGTTDSGTGTGSGNGQGCAQDCGRGQNKEQNFVHNIPETNPVVSPSPTVVGGWQGHRNRDNNAVEDNSSSSPDLQDTGAGQ